MRGKHAPRENDALLGVHVVALVAHCGRPGEHVRDDRVRPPVQHVAAAVKDKRTAKAKKLDTRAHTYTLRQTYTHAHAHEHALRGFLERANFYLDTITHTPNSLVAVEVSDAGSVLDAEHVGEDLVLLELVGRRGEPDPLTLDTVGALVAEAQTVAVLGLRTTLRSLTSAAPGPEASVRKLLGVEHDQRTQEAGLDLLGPEGATVTGDAAQWTFGFLANRCLTIAGGTSEIQRNVIAERLLGLPRDRSDR